LAKLSEICNIPIIASGGAGSIQSLKTFYHRKADAALAASVFHLKRIASLKKKITR
jgi:cyclase